MKLSEDTWLTMRMKVLLALLGVVACGAIAWATTQSSVADHERRLATLESSRVTDRELLVRIDENVKALTNAARRQGDQ